MGKYDRWWAFFRDLPHGVHEIPIEVLDGLIEGGLPPTASREAAWWANVNYQARNWTDHGWYAHPRLAQRVVIYDRVRTVRGRPPAQDKATRPHRLPTPTPLVRRSTEVPTPIGDRLVLLGCVNQKGPETVAAKDLYVSPLWRKRRAYAEATDQPWMILSAEHHLVSPDQLLAPYDRYLEREQRSFREQWSRLTMSQIVAECRRLNLNRVELHAGAAYLEHGLISGLADMGIETDRPLEGLKIGEQLSWYDQRIQKWVPTHTGRDAPDAIRNLSDREDLGAVLQAVAATYNSGALGETWEQLPENWARPRGDPRTSRLWITFVAAVDRARDGNSLWSSAQRAFDQVPWIFVPEEVGQRSLAELSEALRGFGLSQRHSVDAYSWRMISEALADPSCPRAILQALDGGPVAASDLVAALGSRRASGTPLFPLLSGPKIGPMWIRMLAFPGGADIIGIDRVPVAVDTHVQRVTEMLGLVTPRTLDELHRAAIQEVWFTAAKQAGPYGAPIQIDGTAAGIDPALWVLGRKGCTRCEAARRKIPIGPICEMCVLGRI